MLLGSVFARWSAQPRIIRAALSRVLFFLYNAGFLPV